MKRNLPKCLVFYESEKAAEEKGLVSRHMNMGKSGELSGWGRQERSCFSGYHRCCVNTGVDGQDYCFEGPCPYGAEFH